MIRNALTNVVFFRCQVLGVVYIKCGNFALRHLQQVQNTTSYYVPMKLMMLKWIRIL